MEPSPRSPRRSRHQTRCGLVAVPPHGTAVRNSRLRRESLPAVLESRSRCEPFERTEGRLVRLGQPRHVNAVTSQVAAGWIPSFLHGDDVRASGDLHPVHSDGDGNARWHECHAVGGGARIPGCAGTQWDLSRSLSHASSRPQLGVRISYPTGGHPLPARFDGVSLRDHGDRSTLGLSADRVEVSYHVETLRVSRCGAPFHARLVASPDRHGRAQSHPRCSLLGGRCTAGRGGRAGGKFGGDRHIQRVGGVFGLTIVVLAAGVPWSLRGGRWWAGLLTGASLYACSVERMQDFRGLDPRFS